MGWRDPTPWEQRQLEVVCRSCGAYEGEWCSTISGRPADIPHAARYRDALRAERERLREDRK